LIASFVASSNGYQIFGKNADSYVDNQPFENQFKYGYQVRVENDQFQHKYKNPQNVTFGCYGYTQQDVGGEHRIYYVSDQFGYRTVEVGQTVTIFPQPGKSPVQQQWQELPFPADKQIKPLLNRWCVCPVPDFHSQLLTVTIAVSATDDAFNIELKQKDAEVYHEQSFGRNEFNYGYQVERTNSQFQHKVKGPDDVTYGCYGYIDPVGEKHLVYYIADRLGYRLLAPDQPTKVFTERVANSVNKLDADLQGRKLDEKVVAWNDLYLPSTCRRLNEIVSITPPPTTVRPVLPPATTVDGRDGALIGGSNGQDQHYPPSNSIPSQPNNCGHDASAPRPKYPGSIAQFNGFVFPINRNCDDSGRNTADLLAQMQTLNEMVLKVSNTLHTLIESDRNRTTAGDACERVLELLNIQQPVPLLVYVPIMVPYLDGGINGGGTQPPVNPASYAYAKTCSECK
uniref:Uncharacterized protein n=1 Tax=Anopheles stephensi TaxID=30069 RepID=A0A182YJY7_ANOST